MAESSSPAPGDTLFGALFEQSAAAIAGFSIGGRFQSANPAMCRLLGYTEQVLLQTTHLEVIHCEELEAAAGFMWDAAATGGTLYVRVLQGAHRLDVAR